MTDVDIGENTPVDHFGAVLTAIENALPQVRAEVLRGEVPNGGLSAAMLAIKALHDVTAAAIEADTNEFLAAVAALHDDQDAPR